MLLVGLAALLALLLLYVPALDALGGGQGTAGALAAGAAEALGGLAEAGASVPPRPQKKAQTLGHLIEAHLAARAEAEGPNFTRPNFARSVPDGDWVRAQHGRYVAEVWEAYYLERESRGNAPQIKRRAQAAADLVPAIGSQRGLTAAIM